MDSRRSVLLVTATLATVLAIACGLASLESPSPDELRTSQRAPTSRPTSPPRWILPPPGPSLVDESDEGEAESCSAEVREADQLASVVAEECAMALAEGGLCFGPVPFEHENQPASQVANMRDWLAPCGLDDSRMRFDCSENPCLALIDRDAVLEGGDRCEALEVYRGKLPEMDEHLPPEGVWSEWTPVVFDVPTNKAEAIRGLARFDARAAKLEQILEEDAHPADARPTEQPCATARQAITDLSSPDRCEALRSYWKCPASRVELPPGTVERYLPYAEALVQDLRETCPAFAESNHVFDCSGVPCILMADLLPGQAPDDLFCGRRFGSVMFNPRRPNGLAVWMYRGIDQPVYDRFEEELEVRSALAKAELEAQRSP